jgi:hypothetical protein
MLRGEEKDYPLDWGKPMEKGWEKLTEMEMALAMGWASG